MRMAEFTAIPRPMEDKENFKTYTIQVPSYSVHAMFKAEKQKEGQEPE
jgi:hypothetical protein